MGRLHYTIILNRLSISIKNCNTKQKNKKMKTAQTVYNVYQIMDFICLFSPHRKNINPFQTVKNNVIKVIIVYIEQ